MLILENRVERTYNYRHETQFCLVQASGREPGKS